uniref:HAT C-terminal dimerisation domain-containing protein n=1 Tax=Erpetoichthys calabaricus TaxID=27687 RepID=A0A8C4T186_ERPCA
SDHLRKPTPKLRKYDEEKKGEYIKQTTFFKSSLIPNEKLLKASYLVALRVACTKKAHMIAEDLILPSAVDMCKTVLDKECTAKLKGVPLSDNTIGRRIEDIAGDIKAQLIDRLKEGYFAIQLDDSTDVANLAQLLAFVRYCWEGEIIEDLFLCYPMPCRTSGEEVFKVLHNFLSQSGLSRDRCIGICTDGAASITGKHSGVVACVKKEAPNITATHCMIHRQSLAAKNTTQSLSEVWSGCIKVINLIKTRPVYAHTFAILCKIVDSNILRSHDKIAAFKKKLSIWKTRINKKVLDKFPILDDYICNNLLINADLIICDVEQHLQSLADHFDEYFLNDNIANFDWVRSPFDVELTDLAECEQEELAELSWDRSLQNKFKQQSLSSFWLSVASEYPLIFDKAVKILLPFATTYLCETAFSAFTNMKSKCRSRLAVESDLRVSLSKVAPRIDSLCKSKQAHPSH